MLKKFSRTTENFAYVVCAHFVEGNGYRNHCPNCLYSKHVDINPGDRQESCQGLLKPIAQSYHKKKGVIIVHECVNCKTIRRNRISEYDNLERIQQLTFR